jgi:hypothetical protein
MTIVPIELLQHLAAGLPSPGAQDSGHKPPKGFELDRWIEDHGLDVVGPSAWHGGRRWIFNVMPLQPGASKPVRLHRAIIERGDRRGLPS